MDFLQNGSNSSVNHDDYDSDGTSTILLAHRFLRWYSGAIFFIGTALNCNSLLILYRNRQRYNCFAYLLGILVGNLVFLCFFGVYLLVRFTDAPFDHESCRLLIYLMTVHRYFPVLCLMAISVDRYFYLVHWILGGRSLDSAPSNSRRVSYLVVAGILAICLISQLWLIPMVNWDPFLGICGFNHTGIGEPSIMTSLTCMNIILLYFIPFVVSGAFNTKLLLTLFHLKHYTPECEVPVNDVEGAQSMKHLRVSIPRTASATLSTTVTDRSRAPSPCPSLGRAPLERRESAIYLSHQLSQRLARKKRKLAVVLVGMMSLDMILNFPNNFLNLLTSYDHLFMARHHNAYVIMEIGAFILWHLQYLVSPMLVRVPLVWSLNRKQTSKNRIATPKQRERSKSESSSGFLGRVMSLFGVKKGEERPQYPRVWKWPSTNKNLDVALLEPTPRDWMFL